MGWMARRVAGCPGVGDDMYAGGLTGKLVLTSTCKEAYWTPRQNVYHIFSQTLFGPRSQSTRAWSHARDCFAREVDST